MPSHPDRVRRSYHDIVIREVDNPATLNTSVRIDVSRAEIATAMSHRELKQLVLRKVDEGIDRHYGKA